MPTTPPAPIRRCASHRRPFLLACLLGQAISTALLGAVAARLSFDLPADFLEKAVKRFAAQSGLEVLIPGESLAEILTRAVRGEMTARQALDAMLAGTGLAVLQDPKTGAFTVLKNAAGPDDPSAAKRNPTDLPAQKKSDVPDATAKPMNPRKPVALLVSLFSLVAASDPLLGQAVAPGAGAPAGSERDKAVELSPFVVNSSKDTGYQATSTLAGTRLNTPVKDLGASISIYTKDFLDDIGATNSSDLLIYATGMEAAGAGGNFSGAGNDINAEVVVGDGPRVDPQSGSRTRGLVGPNFSRGFFSTGINLDAYNTEAVTVNRGPNAILFGVGSPAGVVDQTLLRPDLQRNQSTIAMRYGNNDSLRQSVDFNRVLIEKKLALRLAALRDRENYNQRPAFEERKRVYGALTFEPLKSSSLRANFEAGRTTANRPITTLPFNSIPEPWYSAGRPGFDWSFYDDPARNPNARTQVAGPLFQSVTMGQVQFSNNPVLVYNQPTDAAPAFGFRGVVPSTSATAANSVKDQLFHPLVNRDLGADTINFLGTLNIFELPASFWTGSRVLPGQRSGQKPAGIKQQGFTDFSAFDFKNRMIDETSRQGDSFHAFNLALEQRAWRDRVGVELAYDTQRVDRRAQNSFFRAGPINHIRVDTTVTLPTGQPNPNLGRPFAEFHTPWEQNFTQRETWRATGFLKYDFKDVGATWGKWLGRHTFTGLYEEIAVETINYFSLIAADGDAARAASATINGRRPSVVVYLGPSIIGNNNPLRLQPIQIEPIAPGPIAVPARYFVRAGNTTDPGAFVDAPVSFVDTNGAGFAQREVIKSQAAVLHSYWLRDHLVTLLGWRRDEDFFVTQRLQHITNPADLNDPGKVHYGFDDFAWPRTPPPNVAAEVKTYSAVLRWPQRLLKLPAGADLSLSYNRSSNFTPDAGRFGPLGETLPAPRGNTEEYGFAISAFNDKLILRANRFETSVRGQSFRNTAYENAQWFGLVTTAQIWAREANTNPHLAAMRNADIELLFSTLPANFRQLHRFEVLGTAPNVTATAVRLTGAVDTTDFVAKGSEFELVFNPTRNWRILANVAKQETVQSNLLPNLKALIARLLPVWKQLADRPRGNYPLGWQPGDPLPASVQTYGDWIDTNVMVPFATALATEGVASAEQRKWRANLVTNYTFGRGSIFGEKLRGWGIGGALRWQDKIGIGYPTSRNADNSGNIDLAHPYYAPAETNVDAWVSYQRKFWQNRLDWKVQLNVRNLIGDTAPIAIGVQPWGEFSTVRLAPERRWYLTNTFSF